MHFLPHIYVLLQFLEDYLSLLLGNNIARFLIIEADSFTVSAISQLTQFEAKPHIFSFVLFSFLFFIFFSLDL